MGHETPAFSTIRHFKQQKLQTAPEGAVLGTHPSLENTGDIVYLSTVLKLYVDLLWSYLVCFYLFIHFFHFYKHSTSLQ